MKGGFEEGSQPHALSLSRPLRRRALKTRWNNGELPGWRRTATNQDYDSQRAARQLHAEGGALGMLGVVVSAALTVRLMGRCTASFSREKQF